MPWYTCIAAFFAGAFLTNAVPHFTNGISGNPFPSPFSKPPGKGLSSPVVNVLWAVFNLIIGYFLFRAGKVSTGDTLLLLLFLAGILAIGIMGAKNFAHKNSV